MKRIFGLGITLGLSALAFTACSSDSGGDGSGGSAGAGNQGGFGNFAGSGNAGGVGNTGGFGNTGNVGGGGTGNVSGGGSGGTGAGGSGGGTGASCKGFCDTPNPVPGSSPECYCDSQCEGFGDCCPDYKTECSSTTTQGACRKYCCAASDCGSGETCAPIDAAQIGSLGVCKSSTPADGGTTDGGGNTEGGTTTEGGTPDAAPPATDAGTGGTSGDAGVTLPAGCVTATNFAVNCDPLTNAGCDSAGGYACDVGQSQGQSGLHCFAPPNNVQPGGQCSNANGPYCIAGYHCDETP